MKRVVRLLSILSAALPLAFVALPSVADEEPSAHEAAGEHEGAAGGEREAHGGGEHEEQEFNWASGFLGEKEGVEPSLLYRPKGTPPPFLANVLNAALLFGMLVGFGRKPIAAALRKRKEQIVAGMEEAGRMKADAAQRLAQYEEKIRHIDQEIERIRLGMREAAEAERRRILEEARERRERMERDTKLLIEQELKAAREMLVRETVSGALRSAEDILAKQLSPGDQDRLATEYLEQIQKAPIRVSGGAS